MLFPKPVRRVFFLIFFLGGGYYAYTTVQPHTRQEVIAYKRYADALLEGERALARPMTTNDRMLEPFDQRDERSQAFEGERRLHYYRVRSITPTQDGTSVNLVVMQVIRYDPPGQSTFWGAKKVINTQFATMKADQSRWLIDNFRDSYYPEL